MRRNSCIGGFPSKWRNRLLSKSLIAIFLILFFMVAANPRAGAQCWTWTTKTLPGPLWQSGGANYYMAFDESLQKLLLVAEDGHGEFQTWTYDGATWEMICDEPPALDVGWYYGPTFGLVYDKNLGASVIFSRISYQFPNEGHYSAFKFNPDTGWSQVGEPFNYGGTVCGLLKGAFTYDTIRKKAIITGFGDAGPVDFGPPITLEFDGSHYTKILNPPDITLNWGSMGYDPNLGKTIFYGFGKDCGASGMQTFEYDGVTWALIESGEAPETEFDPLAGLLYIPSFHGLIGVPSNPDSFQTWLYSNNRWELIHTEPVYPARESGTLGFDYKTNRVVYWGGIIIIGIDAYYSYDTLELSKYYHCRPLSKP